MSRTDWPKLCTLADASRLFEGQGVKVDRSNLSRFVSTRNITKVDGKIDPNVLFDRYTKDYGRAVMAGQTGGASPSPSPAQSPPPAPTSPLFTDAPDDPKRDHERVKARLAQLELDERLGKTLPAEEVAAGMAEAIAELRAAALRSARDEAQRLITDLGAPGHKLGAAVAGLKRYAARMQEAFAAAMLPLLEASSTQDTPARARLDALIAFDMQLRGITEDDAAESETSPPSVEAPHAG